MTTLHRAQLLLEDSQHQALAHIAEQEGRSISDLVREIVGRHLAERDGKTQTAAAMQALEWLTHNRHKLQQEHGTLQNESLSEVREEWEKDVERIWRGEA